jgi:hypothetical protein
MLISLLNLESVDGPFPSMYFIVSTIRLIERLPEVGLKFLS